MVLCPLQFGDGYALSYVEGLGEDTKAALLHAIKDADFHPEGTVTVCHSTPRM